MAWISRYTSLKPEDVKDMEPWQFKVFSESLRKIIKEEGGGDE